MLKKLQPSKRHVNSVDVNSLADKVELILPAMKSEYSDTTFVSVDGPTTNYICYYYDESKEKYLRVTLLSDGDWYYKKNSTASDELIEWLKTLVVK
ncbi:MAG: hypothetical protein HND52_01805 [Ignavibacteriae bacterium]|nr:hypothetical protein [Ignavibacteriota bacterium]NOG96685.1 hypothetical protein [Ignavibacteriota bacterium]